MADPKRSLRVGVVTPVVLQNDAILDMTLRHLALLPPIAHSFEGRQGCLYVCVVANKLTVCTPGELLLKVTDALGPAKPWLVQVVADRERCVAGAWNHGCQLTHEAGCEFTLVMANDVELRAGCLEGLVRFGMDRPDVDLWSGAQERLAGKPGTVTAGADFSCFMTRQDTFDRHGWFDENFRPAYFEDNDYCGRVWLAGREACVVHDARFHHLGSQTIKLDREVKHHVDHWFGQNAAYFERKWGSKPAGTPGEVRQKYHSHPFGDDTKPLSYWPPVEG